MCQEQKNSSVILPLFVIKAIILTGANNMKHIYVCVGKLGSLEIIQKVVPQGII